MNAFKIILNFLQVTSFNILMPLDAVSMKTPFFICPSFLLISCGSKCPQNLEWNLPLFLNCNQVSFEFVFLFLIELQPRWFGMSVIPRTSLQSQRIPHLGLTVSIYIGIELVSLLQLNLQPRQFGMSFIPWTSLQCLSLTVIYTQIYIQHTSGQVHLIANQLMVIILVQKISCNYTLAFSLTHYMFSKKKHDSGSSSTFVAC